MTATRAPRLPYLGASIHLEGYDKCRVALTTGHGEHSPEPGVSEDIMYITIFAPNLKPQEAVLHGSGWHYSSFCRRDANGLASWSDPAG